MYEIVIDNNSKVNDSFSRTLDTAALEESIL